MGTPYAQGEEPQESLIQFVDLAGSEKVDKHGRRASSFSDMLSQESRAEQQRL